VIQDDKICKCLQISNGRLSCHFFSFDKGELGGGRKKEEEMETGKMDITCIRLCSCSCWEDVIAKHPLFLECGACSAFKTSVAFYAPYRAKLETLHFLLDTIESIHDHVSTNENYTDSIPLLRKQMLQNVFERTDLDGWTPAHTAARGGYIDRLVFLVEHSPSGVAVLKTKDCLGNTPLYYASHQDTVEYILQNVPTPDDDDDDDDCNNEVFFIYTDPRRKRAPNISKSLSSSSYSWNVALLP
jgi:hypothetical protein